MSTDPLTPAEVAQIDQIIQGTKIILDELIIHTAEHRGSGLCGCDPTFKLLCCGTDVISVIKSAVDQEDIRETQRLLMMCLVRLADAKLASEKTA